MDIDVTKIPSQPTNPVDRLFVTVYKSEKPEEPTFKGFAKSISSVDGKGPFDVLPQHENFVTEFVGIVTINPEVGNEVSYKASDGVMEVANNVVRIFLKS